MSGLGNPSARCPSCGGGADGYTQAVNEAGGAVTVTLDRRLRAPHDIVAVVPKEGDAAICAYCGAVNMYRADQTLREATDKERAIVLDMAKQAMRVLEGEA